MMEIRYMRYYIIYFSFVMFQSSPVTLVEKTQLHVHHDLFAQSVSVAL